jgi:hypothetical protein
VTNRKSGPGPTRGYGGSPQTWVSSNLLATWKAAFLEKAHTIFPGDERRDEDQARIAELEPLLGWATRPIAILTKASTLRDAASTSNGR